MNIEKEKKNEKKKKERINEGDLVNLLEEVIIVESSAIITRGKGVEGAEKKRENLK